MGTNTLSYTLHDSPIGSILLAGTSKGLQHIAFQGGNTLKKQLKPDDLARDGWECAAAPFSKACQQLDEYFAGKRRTFNITLAPQGTDFQQQVWQHLRTIPYGETCSYGAIATKLGNSNASRAIGAANGANPLPIIVPCHRVIGANGKLTGFAGLSHERGEQSLFSFDEMQVKSQL